MLLLQFQHIAHMDVHIRVPPVSFVTPIIPLSIQARQVHIVVYRKKMTVETKGFGHIEEPLPARGASVTYTGNEAACASRDGLRRAMEEETVLEGVAPALRRGPTTCWCP